MFIFNVFNLTLETLIQRVPHGGQSEYKQQVTDSRLITQSGLERTHIQLAQQQSTQKAAENKKQNKRQTLKPIHRQGR